MRLAFISLTGNIVGLTRLCPIIHPVFSLGIVPPKPERTNPAVSLLHLPSTSNGFREEKSLVKALPRRGKTRATFRTRQALPACLPCLAGRRSEKMNKYNSYKNHWTKPVILKSFLLTLFKPISQFCPCLKLDMSKRIVGSSRGHKFVVSLWFY